MAKLTTRELQLKVTHYNELIFLLEAKYDRFMVTQTTISGGHARGKEIILEDLRSARRKLRACYNDLSL